jgi:hypothetical protein
VIAGIGEWTADGVLWRTVSSWRRRGAGDRLVAARS